MPKVKKPTKKPARKKSYKTAGYLNRKNKSTKRILKNKYGVKA